MPALDTHQRSQLMFFMRALNISRGECHHHSVGMPRRLLVDGVDQIESVPGKMALIGFRMTQMEKNSAPRLPRFALSRLMCPMSLGSLEPRSKFSSRKRCGVSACVSMMRAES